MQVGPGEIGSGKVGSRQVEPLEIGAREIAPTAILAASRQQIGRISRAGGSSRCRYNPEAKDQKGRGDQGLHGGPPLSFSIMIGKALFVAAGIALAGLGSQAAAEEAPVYRGSAQVVGPAMLSLAVKRVVLYGVDAPVKGQPCYAGAKIWDCATASAKTLLNLVGTQEIACEQRRVDGFGRVFAVCEAGEVDINRALVEAGMAVALPKETPDYVASEAAAKSKGVGVWRGPFTAPADYREMLAGHPQER
jgi:endonuclease YncB( thermonuclease family)